jgi:hypothetical protein
MQTQILGIPLQRTWDLLQNQYGSVGKAGSLQAGRIWNRVWILGSAQRPVCSSQRTYQPFGKCGPGIKQPGREANRSPPSAENKNYLSYTLSSPYVFMLQCLIEYREKFASFISDLYFILSIILWERTLCSPFKVKRRFGGKYRLHHQGRKISLARNQRESSSSHLLSRWFLARLILRPWRWRRYVPPKLRLTLNGLYGVISQKMVLFFIVL